MTVPRAGVRAEDRLDLLAELAEGPVRTFAECVDAELERRPTAEEEDDDLAKNKPNKEMKDNLERKGDADKPAKDEADKPGKAPKDDFDKPMDDENKKALKDAFDKPAETEQRSFASPRADVVIM